MDNYEELEQDEFNPLLLLAMIMLGEEEEEAEVSADFDYLYNFILENSNEFEVEDEETDHALFGYQNLLAIDNNTGRRIVIDYILSVEGNND